MERHLHGGKRFDIGDGARLSRGADGGQERGNYDRGEQGDDEDDDHQLHEREPALWVVGVETYPHAP